MSGSQTSVSDTISLDGQVAIVTGAGHGLGRAYALELAQRGAAVVVNDIDPDAADGVVAEIDAAGGRAVAAPVTVGTPEGGEEIVEIAVKAFGTVDSIVHNAGSWRNAPIEDMTAEHLDAVLDVHLRGAFFLVRPAWKIMAEKGFGRIVLTSSSAGAYGRKFGANYVAAKSALIGVARALAQEGEEYGIKANAILPNAQTSLVRRPMNPEYRARMDASLGVILPRRTPEMVAPFVTYLVSKECSVTAEAFAVGCGHFARVFIGMTAGWASVPSRPATPEEIMAHLDEIEDREGYVVPNSMFDDMESVTAALLRVDAEALIKS